MDEVFKHGTGRQCSLSLQPYMCVLARVCVCVGACKHVCPTAHAHRVDGGQQLLSNLVRSRVRRHVHMCGCLWPQKMTANYTVDRLRRVIHAVAFWDLRQI